MGRFWTQQETVRKQEMLGAQRALSMDAQAAVRCAECILARPATYEEEGPSSSFAATEINMCTGLSDKIITGIMQKVIQAGSLEKETNPPAIISNNKRLTFYRPLAQEDGRLFFVPALVPDCDRTTQQTSVERLTPNQRGALACIAHLATADLAGVDLSKPNVLSCTALSQETMWGVFDFFVRMGVLEATGSRHDYNGRPVSRYVLTEKGIWLSQGLSPLDTCSAATLLAQAKPYPPPPIEKASAMDRWIAQKVQEHYPEQLRAAILDRLTILLEQGILQISPELPGSLPLDQEATKAIHNKERERVEFTPRAASYLGSSGRAAIAHWLQLDFLLYGRLLPTQDIRRILQLSPEASLIPHIKSRIYEPLIARLASKD